MRVVKWRWGWVNYTSWQLLPVLRVGSVFAFVGWLKFEVGFWTQRAP